MRLILMFVLLLAAPALAKNDKPPAASGASASAAAAASASAGAVGVGIGQGGVGGAGGSASANDRTTVYAAPGMAGAPAYSCAMSYSVSAVFVGFTWSTARDFCEVLLLLDALQRHGNNPEAVAMLRATSVYREAAAAAGIAVQPPAYNAGN